MQDRIKWVKHNLLLKWTETIGNTVTEDGITLNKYGAESLNKDLNEIWNLLDDMQRLLSEMEKELVNEEPTRPKKVCTMGFQGVFCNECTQYWNCDILAGIADEQVIEEETLDEES